MSLVGQGNTTRADRDIDASDGRRITVRVAPFRPGGARKAQRVGLRLRLDKVATALVRRVRSAVQRSVPENRTVMVTVTAPIRLAARTAEAIEARIRSRLRGGAAGHSVHRLHGNTVHIWVWKRGSCTTSKLLGFVHNPGTDPTALMEATRALLRALGQPRCVPAGPTGKWLIIEDSSLRLSTGAYQNLCGQLRLETAFERICLRRAGGGIVRLSLDAQC